MNIIRIVIVISTGVYSSMVTVIIMLDAIAYRYPGTRVLPGTCTPMFALSYTSHITFGTFLEWSNFNIIHHLSCLNLPWTQHLKVALWCYYYDKKWYCWSWETKEQENYSQKIEISCNGLSWLDSWLYRSPPPLYCPLALEWWFYWDHGTLKSSTCSCTSSTFT